MPPDAAAGRHEPPIVPFEPWMQPEIVGVVRAVHDEYGFTWESYAYHRDLHDIARYYLDAGGAMWAALEGRRVVGCVGVTPHGGACELHRLYLLPEARGCGLGRRLLETAIGWARRRGSSRMIAWSDVKLGLAHRLYLSRGFRLFGQRQLDDLDRSVEHGFILELT